MVTLKNNIIKGGFEPAAITSVNVRNTTAGAIEEVIFTPTCADDKTFIMIENKNESGHTLTVRVEDSANAGKYPYVIKVPQATAAMVAVETAYVLKKNGTVKLLFAPPTGVNLTACGASAYAISRA